jgi:hypothetical protein
MAFNYRGVEYALRLGITRGEWVLVIHYPDGRSAETRFSGTREAAMQAARDRIHNWLQRNQPKSATGE